MDTITVGLLTVSDRCSTKEMTDESGPCLQSFINRGIFKNGLVTKMHVVPDCEEEIKKVLIEWCDESINLILITGGTGISERDVTPEATAAVVNKTIPGISSLFFNHSFQETPLAALSRGIAGVRGKTLIINLPGSKKASMECLKAAASIIPHAIDLITGNIKAIEKVHGALEGKKTSLIKKNLAVRSRFSNSSCISVSEAQKIVTERVFFLLKEKTVSHRNALTYVLAQDVVAQENLPPFDVSLKDGYAVLVTNKSHVSEVIGVSEPGNPVEVEVKDGFCVKISTGAAIPRGADAVVEVENTQIQTLTEDNTKEKTIFIHKFPVPYSNIRPLGSDFKAGEKVLKSKTYLDPAAIGLLAAAGVNFVRVYDKPQVGIFSTGNEINPCGDPLPFGKVRDSNRMTLISLLKEENFETVDLDIVPDEPEALRETLERGFRMVDIIVTTGSLSMGEKDYLKRILEADFNADIVFGGVFMKPGKPTSFAILEFEGKPKLWFGLPGNPASAFVSTQLFLLPALRSISGYEKVFPVRISAAVDKWILIDRPHYVRGILTYEEKTDSWFASVKEDQSSSRIRSCVNTNCLLEFPSKQSSEINRKTLHEEKNFTGGSVTKVKAFLTGKNFLRA